MSWLLERIESSMYSCNSIFACSSGVLLAGNASVLITSESSSMNLLCFCRLGGAGLRSQPAFSLISETLVDASFTSSSDSVLSKWLSDTGSKL